MTRQQQQSVRDDFDRHGIDPLDRHMILERIAEEEAHGVEITDEVIEAAFEYVLGAFVEEV